ncbi:MAG: helix-turn-helix domain-containing protein [Stenotrophobium sp.]
MSSLTPNTHSDERPPFASMLKSWREDRKQSQLDLSLTAGISQRHLSYLELGRAQPSREMVNQLAEALDIPLRERNVLHTAAGFAPLYRERGLDDAAMSAIRQALDLQLKHHEPFPALVLDRAWTVLSGNAAVARVFGLFGPIGQWWEEVCPQSPHNVLKMLLHPKGMRPFISNWHEAAPALLSRLRREAESQGIEKLRMLLKELLAYPDIPPEWRVARWSAPPPPVVALEFRKDDLRLNLFTMISTFGTPQDITTDEIRVELFYPADEGSATLMRQLHAEHP